MRCLRLVILLCILLQLAKAESSDSEEKIDDVASADAGDRDLSMWSKDTEAEENVVEEEDQVEEEVETQLRDEEDEEVVETTEVPYERELTPGERLVIEAELRWQLDMEERESRERKAALHDPDPVGDTLEDEQEQSGNPKELFQGDAKEPQNEDEAYDAYLERQRRLGSQPVVDDDDEEEEALPVIPGLTDVELIAFNPEYANEEVLDKIIDWSYDQVAGTSRYRDNYIHVEDLYPFLLKTLNPLDEEIDEEDEQILTDAVTELRRQQGLVDDEQVVYRGFIARGMPLRFLQSLAHEMHQTVQTRRLQASDEL